MILGAILNCTESQTNNNATYSGCKLNIIFKIIHDWEIRRIFVAISCAFPSCYCSQFVEHHDIHYTHAALTRSLWHQQLEEAARRQEGADSQSWRVISILSSSLPERDLATGCETPRWTSTAQHLCGENGMKRRWHSPASLQSSKFHF